MAPDADPIAAPGANLHSIDLLGLHPRARGALRRAGIHTLEALAQLSDAELLLISGIGPVSIAVIRAGLARFREQLSRGVAPSPPPSPPRLRCAPRRPLLGVWQLPPSLASDDTPIAALGLRARGMLARGGVATIRDLVQLSLTDARAMTHAGPGRSILHLVHKRLTQYICLMNVYYLLP